MEEIYLDTIKWQGPEYFHKEKSIDFLWTIGITAIVFAAVAAWFSNYVFALFILISGACLILFSVRPPEILDFVISTEGIALGKNKYTWKNLKGFHIHKGDVYYKLLIETDRKFLPIFTIPLPPELSPEVKATLQKVLPDIDLKESPSMQFMEKLGF